MLFTCCMVGEAEVYMEELLDHEEVDDNAVNGGWAAKAREASTQDD